MKKTAKQLVYDALDHMRKPALDIALSPIQDSDDVFKTYGFVESDVCKLCAMMSLDAEITIPHEPIHAVSTVGEIVTAIQKIIKAEEDLNKEIKSISKITDVAILLMEIGEIPMNFDKLMVRLSKFKALHEATGLSTLYVEEIEKGAIAMFKAINASNQHFNNHVSGSAMSYAESVDFQKVKELTGKIAKEYKQMFKNG